MKKKQSDIEQYLREEFEKEAKETLEEVENDKDLETVKVPDEMYEQILVKINAFEQEQAASKQLDDSYEVPRYARRKVGFSRKKTCGLVAAAAVLVIGAGVTSVGGPQYILETMQQKVGGREMTQTDTKNQKKVNSGIRNEEEAFELIKEELGVEPVRLNYLPNGTKFKGCEIFKDLYTARLEFEYNGRTLVYRIQANYTQTSYGIDVEDKLIDEWTIATSGAAINIKQYMIEETGEMEYEATFKYNNVEYSFSGILQKEELQKILQNLYFL